MTRTQESSRGLGGIGTMLLQSEICPACGKAHESRLVRYLPSIGHSTTPAPVATSLSTPSARGRKAAPLSATWPFPRVTEETP